MSDPLEQVPLSEELLAVMRNAGTIAQRLGEAFIGTRELLLALFEEPQIGSALAAVIPREPLERLVPPENAPAGATRLLETGLMLGERPAHDRYDTLAFTAADGKSVWLTHEAMIVFAEGARRVEERYMPKHLAFGIAAEAVRSPGVLASLHVSPGVVNDAIYKL